MNLQTRELHPDEDYAYWLTPEYAVIRSVSPSPSSWEEICRHATKEEAAACLAWIEDDAPPDL